MIRPSVCDAEQEASADLRDRQTSADFTRKLVRNLGMPRTASMARLQDYTTMSENVLLFSSSNHAFEGVEGGCFVSLNNDR